MTKRNKIRIIKIYSSLVILIVSILLIPFFFSFFILAFFINILDVLYIKIFNPSEIYITSWAPKHIKSNLDKERWVMIGKGNIISYLASGIVGPDYNCNKGRIVFKYFPFKNKSTKLVNINHLSFPKGSFSDGAIKGIFGQRKYIP